MRVFLFTWVKWSGDWGTCQVVATDLEVAKEQFFNILPNKILRSYEAAEMTTWLAKNGFVYQPKDK